VTSGIFFSIDKLNPALGGRWLRMTDALAGLSMASSVGYTKGEGCILVLNNATFQFSRMELPTPFKLVPFSIEFQLGHTKDGEFCVVCVQQCMLSVWLWAADDDGVERFMLHKTFPLRSNV
jgi:hypothetical protein